MNIMKLTISLKRLIQCWELVNVSAVCAETFLYLCESNIVQKTSLFDNIGDGMTRQAIIVYFKCFEPERGAAATLPPIEPVAGGFHFLKLVATLPLTTRIKILQEYDR